VKSGRTSFPFLRINQREGKPRRRGLTEIRGPYYSVVGRRYLGDLFETMGNYVDSLKFAGGSFALMPAKVVREIVDLCHKHDVLVSTGGFIERVLAQGGDAVRQYVAECKRLGFDIVEISAGFISISTDDWLRLVETQSVAVQKRDSMVVSIFLLECEQLSLPLPSAARRCVFARPSEPASKAPSAKPPPILRA
jgi:phosphosulfolactate synthase (CoM biosynthesis protein A)